MATHTARLIFTILFLVFAVSGLVSGYWFQALVWALIAFAVGYPFVRKGRVDLYYEGDSDRVVYYVPPVTGEGPAMPSPEGTPPMLRQLMQGNI